jgi:hypothetical protein
MVIPAAHPLSWYPEIQWLSLLAEEALRGHEKPHCGLPVVPTALVQSLQVLARFEFCNLPLVSLPVSV